MKRTGTLGIETQLPHPMLKVLNQVFLKMCLADEGKELAHLHENTCDAHTIHQELSTYCKKSTTAQLKAYALLSYITPVRTNN